MHFRLAVSLRPKPCGPTQAETDIEASRRRLMPTETLAASLLVRVAVAGGPKPCLALLASRGLPGLPRLGRVMGQARATRSAEAIDTVDHNHWLSGPDSRATAARETSLAALVDRRADDSHRPPRRVDRPAPRRGCRIAHNRGSATCWALVMGRALGLASGCCAAITKIFPTNSSSKASIPTSPGSITSNWISAFNDLPENCHCCLINFSFKISAHGRGQSRHKRESGNIV